MERRGPSALFVPTVDRLVGPAAASPETGVTRPGWAGAIEDSVAAVEAMLVPASATGMNGQNRARSRNRCCHTHSGSGLVPMLALLVEQLLANQLPSGRVLGHEQRLLLQSVA